MQKTSSKKPLIIVVILIVIGVFVYFYFAGKPQDSSGLVSQETPEVTEALRDGAEVLMLLNQIEALTIDAKFFQSAVYKSLVDHEVPIYEQPVGKTNPFYNPNPPKKSK